MPGISPPSPLAATIAVSLSETVHLIRNASNEPSTGRATNTLCGCWESLASVTTYSRVRTDSGNTPFEHGYHCGACGRARRLMVMNAGISRKQGHGQATRLSFAEWEPLASRRASVRVCFSDVVAANLPRVGGTRAMEGGPERIPVPASQRDRSARMMSPSVCASPMTIDDPSRVQLAPRGIVPSGRSISLRNGTGPSGSRIQM